MDEEKKVNTAINDEKEKPKKRRRSKNTVYDKKSGTMTGQRKLRKIGDGYYLNVPREFILAHGLKEGDIIPFIAKYTCKFIPIKKNDEYGDI